MITMESGLKSKRTGHVGYVPGAKAAAVQDEGLWTQTWAQRSLTPGETGVAHQTCLCVLIGKR